MKDHMERYEASTLFLKSLRKEFLRRLVSFPFGSEVYKIPDLESLVRNVPPKSETYVGIAHIPVSKIIGTENRSRDFSSGFLPRNPWMERRWMEVMVQFLNDKIDEPVKLIEYGGAYFVRDGNHRVSIAKAAKIDFVTAEITKYSIPINLPDSFDMTKLPLLKAKAGFYERTGVFDFLDESCFRVNRAETWEALEKEIFIDNRAWFIRKNNREPVDSKELLDSWNKNIYGNTVDYLESNSLLYLYKGYEITDMFILFVNFWNSFKNPDDFWLEEMYLKFSRELHRKKFYKEIIRIGAQMIGSLFESDDTARKRFYRATQIEELRPGFTVPVENKYILLFLYRQVFWDHAMFLKGKLKRAPYIQELTSDWYDHFYLPLSDHYWSRNCKMSFNRFYRRFSKRYFRKFISSPDQLPLYISEFCGNCPGGNPEKQIIS